MKFVCCGVVYSTNDPETFWCIDKYVLREPLVKKVNGHEIVKEIVYSLLCKKHNCTKIEIFRISESEDGYFIAERKPLKGEKAKKYLERTKEMRIKQPQCCPIKPVKQSKKIPWVYGKSIDGYTQIPRYIDESGNRDVFKDNSWERNIIKPKTRVYNI